MTLFAQHGYGKADKLDKLGAAGDITGVVLSPADETPAAMQSTVMDMRARAVSTLLDPQTYIYSIVGAVGRCHDDHGLNFGQMSWGSVGSADIDRHVGAVVAANHNVGTDGPLISPAPRQQSFSDPWTPFAFQYARATIAAAQSRPVLASVMIEEAGLGDWTAIEQWLDVATTLEVAGFYLVIGRRGNYPIPWENGLLANLLRLIYRLSVLNDYGVVVGYSDIAELACIAVGAQAIASGWNYRQRNFCTDRWIPRDGGQAAIPRVTAIGLLAPLLAIGEASTAVRSSVGDRVLGDAALRARIAATPSSWSNPEAQLQHLQALAELVGDVESQGGLAARLDRLAVLAAGARALAADLGRLGVRIDPAHGSRVASMEMAVATMRRLEGV